MAAVQVIEYRVGWDIDGNQGGISLRLADGQESNIAADSAAELASLAAILDKSPVTYDEDGKRLVSGWVRVGQT